MSLAVERDRALGHLVVRVAHQGVAQRALARAVGAHQGVDLALADRQVDPLEDLLAVDGDVQVLDRKDLAHQSLALLRSSTLAGTSGGTAGDSRDPMSGLTTSRVRHGYPVDPSAADASRSGEAGLAGGPAGSRAATGLASKSQERSPSSRHWLSRRPRPEHLLEHLPLQGADGAVGLGQLVVGAGVLAEDRRPARRRPGRPRPRSPGRAGRAELDQPAFPVVAGDLGAVHSASRSVIRAKRSRRSLRSADRPHHLVPEDDGQVGIILPQPLVRLDARLVAMPRAGHGPVLGPPLDQPRRQQPGQPVPDRRRRHPQHLGHLGDRQRAPAADQIQEFAIRRVRHPVHPGLTFIVRRNSESSQDDS